MVMTASISSIAQVISAVPVISLALIGTCRQVLGLAESIMSAMFSDTLKGSGRDRSLIADDHATFGVGCGWDELSPQRVSVPVDGDLSYLLIPVERRVTAVIGVAVRVIELVSR